MKHHAQLKWIQKQRNKSTQAVVNTTMLELSDDLGHAMGPTIDSEINTDEERRLEQELMDLVPTSGNAMYAYTGTYAAI